MEKKKIPLAGLHDYYVREDGQITDHRGYVIEVSNRGIVELIDAKIQQPVYVAVSYVVALAFINRPRGARYVLYKDGDPRNLHYTNLRWGDRYDNVVQQRRMQINAPEYQI